MSYGTDSWASDRRRTGRLTTGTNTVVLALYRRTITSRGTLRGGPDEAVYGFDLSELIGAVGPDLAVRAIPGQLRGEFLKDDRVSDVTVDAAITTGADGLTDIELSVEGTLRDSDEPFAFVLIADDVTVELVGGATTP